MTTEGVLVSFDVDGTLVRSVGENANKLHKEAFATAFSRVFSIDTTIDVIPHHGSTDPLILLKVLEYHGIDATHAMEKLPDMQAAMIDYFIEHKCRAAIGLEVLPGVKKLLEELQSMDHVHVGLCTGNLEPIAWAKMDALGLKDMFTTPQFGGFGSDYCSGSLVSTDSWKDRAELVRIAYSRGLNQSNGIQRRFHVGDAPMDVMAAKHAGSHALGLLTGIFSRDDLSTANPEAIILDDLCDTEKVLDILLGRVSS
eukprot:CAMPEP_0118802808 /NCGR_PEP_ID=MMETSP1161-20130426/12293_1 /TAXON_ID=249345 /ORGANISM="Picochlorum oklahomensis, Strain CCMP2329" /LENGTH=254 /DNA_ID=CAMNT_0006731159 /DNA_START=97 /DNA_END=861 /DNA_ORIENTATION=-